MNWINDILGDKIEQLTIPLQEDYGGKVCATLIRRQSETVTDKAILYIHGFNDYFFQKEMTIHFNENAINFYALDLRRYGRSFRSDQNFNDIRDLKSYYEEISKAIDIIKEEGNDKLILMGHSTGGLIATLFAKDNTDRGMFDGLILNSPFYEFNMSSWVKKKMIPYAVFFGKYFPNISIAGALSEEYGESLHKDYKGEWAYDLQLKPNTPPPITLGWLRAIRMGHKELKKSVNISEPILLMHSTRTITNKFDIEQMYNMDAVLNVNDIQNIGKNIIGNVTAIPIEGGMHDLILSKKEVRERVYSVMLEWTSKI